MLRDHLQPKPHHHHPGEQIRRIQTIRLDKYNGLRIATTIKVIEHVQGSFDRKKKKVSPAYKRSRSNKR